MGKQAPNSDSSIALAPPIVEDHRLVPAYQNAVLEVPADGARQHDAFQVATLLHQVFELIAMGDARDILLDDGAVVQHRGHVVAGGADQFHAPLEGRVVRLGAAESGQKRMVDINQPPGIPRYELGREDLHVARQHHQIDPVLREQFQLTPLRFRLPVFRNRDVMERNAEEPGQRRGVLMVADDQRHFTTQLASAMAMEQVRQAMLVAGDEDRRPQPPRGVFHPPAHVEPPRDGLELLPQRLGRQVELLERPLHAHEEQPQILILVLIGVQDVRAVRIQKVGNCGDQALAVGAIDQENGGVSVFHKCVDEVACVRSNTRPSIFSIAARTGSGTVTDLLRL